MRLIFGREIDEGLADTKFLDLLTLGQIDRYSKDNLQVSLKRHFPIRDS